MTPLFQYFKKFNLLSKEAEKAITGISSIVTIKKQRFAAYRSSIVERNIKGDFSDINPVDLEAGANRCAIS